ncbi:hypothetical protein D0Z00_002369 [Geotrichum galactomycetum]|uniref:Uncharacterized protein n=1 Tax=Geotrichum galactomycetum TaxID=27317 RepID=A0ACB6V4H0_9ASCO|nr:hypothetical protein D0Z00_002369 [Geotrichum candidum]
MASTHSNSVKFYNYHEYILATAQEQREQLGYATGHDEDDDSFSQVLLTHFENPHLPATGSGNGNNSNNDATRAMTRIIRIPREFSANNDLYPQFSTFYPGTEPGALTPADGGGLTSTSPLWLYLNEAELHEIVSSVNMRLEAALSPYRWQNVVDHCLNLVCCWLFDRIRDPYVKHRLRELETAVAEMNIRLAAEGKPVRVISPLRTGYLSLDIEIPRPPPVNEYT